MTSGRLVNRRFPEHRLTRKRAGERGVALIIALLMLLVISALAASVIFVTNTDVWASGNYRTLIQARYAAEAGAQTAANWLSYTYTAPANTANLNLTVTPVTYNANPVLLSAQTGVTGNYPDAAVQTAFNTALQNIALPGLPTVTYSVTATLLKFTPGSPTLPIQTWRITSTGAVAGVRPASVQVVMTVERTGTVSPAYAVFATGTGCGALSMSGAALTDSFDSSAGTYAATHQLSGGDVGTNGNLTMAGSSKVNGGLWTPKNGTGICSGGSVKALTTSGTASVSGGVTQLPSAQSYPTPPAPSPVPPPSAYTVPNGSNTLTPGSYGNITAGGIAVFHMSTGTYNVNSIALTNSGQLVVDSGPVVINIMGTGQATVLSLAGAGVANNTGVPANLQINYAGAGAINVNNGAAAYLTINAPNAAVTVNGAGGVFGSIIGGTVTLGNSGVVHFDRALSGTGSSTVGANRPIAFSWSKY